MHQTAVHGGVAPYRPNSLDGGCPFRAGSGLGAFIDVPEQLAAAVKERKSPASFDDHYSQVRLFFRSLAPVEQDHVIQAYTFELGKCFEEPIRRRQLAALANIDAGLCAAVAAGLGLPVPEATEQVPDSAPSPALSQLGGTWPVAGRVVGIVADGDSDLEAVKAARTALDAAGMVPLVIAPSGGTLDGNDGGLPAQRTYLTARSTEFDAVLIAGSGAPAPDASQGRDAKAGQPGDGLDPRLVLLLTELFRHAKAIGGWGQAVSCLHGAGIPTDSPGIALGEGPDDVIPQLTGLLAAHRAWERFPAAGA
jgi:catalase